LQDKFPLKGEACPAVGAFRSSCPPFPFRKVDNPRMKSSAGETACPTCRQVVDSPGGQDHAIEGYGSTKPSGSIGYQLGFHINLSMRLGLLTARGARVSIYPE
jgi:hypothetical protein